MMAEWEHWVCRGDCIFGTYTNGWAMPHDYSSDSLVAVQFYGDDSWWVVAHGNTAADDKKHGKVGPFPDAESAIAAAKILMSAGSPSVGEES